MLGPSSATISVVLNPTRLSLGFISPSISIPISAPSVASVAVLSFLFAGIAYFVIGHNNGFPCCD